MEFVNLERTGLISIILAPLAFCQSGEFDLQALFHPWCQLLKKPQLLLLLRSIFDKPLLEYPPQRK